MKKDQVDASCRRRFGYLDSRVCKLFGELPNEGHPLLLRPASQYGVPGARPREPMGPKDPRSSGDEQKGPSPSGEWIWAWWLGS